MTITPCQTCKDCELCYARAVTEREAIFAWSYGATLECDDYREDSYHGIEGVVDAASLDSVCSGVTSGSNSRNVRVAAVDSQDAQL